MDLGFRIKRLGFGVKGLGLRHQKKEEDNSLNHEVHSEMENEMKSGIMEGLMSTSIGNLTRNINNML